MYEQTFTIETDHKPLKGLLNAGLERCAPTNRGRRWARALATCEYKIAYNAGKANADADVLSRLPLSEIPECVPVPEDTVLLLEHLDHKSVNSRHIREWTSRAAAFSRVYQFTVNGRSLHHSDAELQPYLISRKAELTIEDRCVLWSNSVIVPPQGRPLAIAELVEPHPGI